MTHCGTDLYHFDRQEVGILLKKARRIARGPSLDFLISPQAKECGRLLVITPKKIGNAPERNKVRRRLKALFYQEQLYTKGYDCIAIIKPLGITSTFDELKTAVLAAIARIPSSSL